MTNSNQQIKTLVLNVIKYLRFGFKLYENGVCDEPIRNEFKLVNNTEMYGYTKKEASDLLGLSVRHFDRLVTKGELPEGKKIRGKTTLFWDKTYIDRLSKKKHP